MNRIVKSATLPKGVPQGVPWWELAPFKELLVHLGYFKNQFVSFYKIVLETVKVMLAFVLILVLHSGCLPNSASA